MPPGPGGKAPFATVISDTRTCRFPASGMTVSLSTTAAPPSGAWRSTPLNSRFVKLIPQPDWTGCLDPFQKQAEMGCSPGGGIERQVAAPTLHSNYSIDPVSFELDSCYR